MSGMQRFLRLNAAAAEAAMKPQLVDGKWKQPLLSGRKVAMVKKHASRNGLLGTWEEGRGGWLETWDRPQKHHVMRPLKGHKNQRNEFDRVKKVQAALAAMPGKFADHKKAVKQSKPQKGLEKWLNEKDPY
uniref:Large ribosomal subunit protein mL59 domain-containing protein n=1 Tax=Peronospora matthiolae TaxID=2874970 RepID=A0AAV1TUL1_9STRA